MVGSPLMTLEATGGKIGGLTKERVRQMVTQTEKAAISQQHRLKPLIDATSDIVKKYEGRVYSLMLWNL